jgi:predicted PurR-regulated permease PerM
MFVGMFIIAIGQGLIMGLLYWIAGVPYLGPLTMVSMVAAMLPLGASLVALPVGIVTLLLGNYVPALIILAGYLLIVANVDNLVRPRLVSKDAYLSFAAVMVSALGGYALFGFFGVIYGPVLMILFQTTVDVYQDHYLAVRTSREDPESAANADGVDDKLTTTPKADTVAASASEGR